MSGRAPINALFVPQLQPAGKRVGPFSAATQAWSGPAGSGFPLVPGTFVGNRYYRSAGSTNNQTLYAFNNLGVDGQRIILSNARTCSFFNGASSAVMPGPPNYLGLQHMLVGNIGGTLWISQNGSTGVSFAIPGGALIPGGVTAVQAYGADVSSASFACTQTSLLQSYVITGAAFTPAEMGAITVDKNSLDRWHASKLVTAAAGLQWLLNWPDWDGASATFAGTGPGAITLTRAGGGGGQTTMPAQDRYRIPPKAKQANASYSFIGIGSAPAQRGAWRSDTFSVTQLITDAVDTTGGPAGMCIECFGRNLGIVANANAGVNIAGTNVAGNNVGGAEMSVFDYIESIDVPGFGAGAAKTIKITDTLQSIVRATGEIQPNTCPQFVRVAHGTPLAFVDAYAATFTRAQRFVGDSLMQEQLGLTDVPGVKGPAYEMVPPLQRVAHATDLISACMLGGDTWFDHIATAAGIEAFVLSILDGLRGTVDNWARFMFGQNDSFFNTYNSQATFRTQLGLFFTALKAEAVARSLPGFKCQIAGPTAYNGVGGSPTQYPASTANGSGFFLADFSTSMSTAIATFADADFSYVDFVTAVTSAVSHKPDNKHLNAAGAVQLSAAWDANLPP